MGRLAATLESLKNKPLSWEQDSGQDSPYDSLKKLNYTQNVVEEAQLQGDTSVDPEEVFQEANILKSEASLDTEIESQVNVEVQRTSNAVPGVLESQLADIQLSGGVTEFDLQNIRALGTFEMQAAAMRASMGGSLLTTANIDEIKARQEQAQREAQQKADETSQMYFAGMSKQQVEEEIGGIEVPIFAPEDILVDFLVAPAALAFRTVRTAGKALSASAAKEAAKKIPSEVLYGSMAGGFMTVADYLAQPGAVTMLSGIVGPTVSAALFTASRKGLAQWLAKAQTGNVDLYNELRQFAKQAEADGKYTKVMREIFDDLDNNRISIDGGEKTVQLTPLAKSDLNGEAEIGRALEIQAAALGTEPSRIKTAAENVTQTGSATHVSMYPDNALGDVIPLTANRLPSWYIRAGEDDIIPGVKILPQVIEGVTDLGSYVNNATTLGKILADSNYINSTMDVSDREFTELLFNRYYNNGDWFAGEYVQEGFRMAAAAAGKGEISSSHGWLGRNIPRTQTSRMGPASRALVETPTYALRQAQELDRVASRIQNNILKGLDASEQGQLDSIIANGRDLNKSFEYRDGGLYNKDQLITSNSNIITAYGKYRMYADKMHFEFNRAVNRDLKREGWEMLDDSIVVKPLNTVPQGEFSVVGGAKMSRSKLQEGDKVYKVKNFDDPGKDSYIILSQSDQLGRLKELDEGLQTLGKREGWSPRYLEDKTAKFFITSFDRKTGKAKTLLAGETKVEAEALAKELTSADPSLYYIAHRRGTMADTGSVDVGINGDLMSFLRSRNASELTTLREILAKTGEFDKEAIDLLISLGKKYNFGGQAFKRRGDTKIKAIKDVAGKLSKLNLEEEGTDAAKELRKLLADAEDAPLKPALDATAEYATRLSKRIATYELHKKLEDDFVSTYKDVLTQPLWNAPAKTGADRLDPITLAKANEAAVVQQQLRNVFGVPTTEARAVLDENFVQLAKLGDVYEESHKKIGKFILNIMKEHKLDTVKLLAEQGQLRGPQLLKTAGAHAAFLFNESQFLVQQSGMIFALGKHYLTDPLVATQAMKDVQDAYIRAFLWKKLGGTPEAGAGKMLDLIERAGFNAMYKPDILDGTGAQLGKRQTRFGQVVDLTMRVGYVPMRTGEGLARAVAFFSEYRAIEKAIKNGAHPRLVKKDLDTDKMLVEVSAAAERIAGNFTKLNRGALTREGFKSAATQFLDFPIIAGEILFGKSAQVTRLQKIGMYTAFGGAFGLEGIPYFWDIVEAGESITDNKGRLKRDIREGIQFAAETFGESLGADDELVQFLSTGLQRGAVSAWTKDQIALSSRATLAAMVPSFVETMSVTDLAGPGLAAMANAIAGTANTLDDLMVLHEGGNLTLEAAAKSAGINFSRISGIRNKARAYANDGKFRDKFGNVLVDEVSFWDRAQIALGMRPYSLVKATELEWESRQRIQQEEEIRKRVAAQIRRLPIEQQIERAILEAQILMEKGNFPASQKLMSEIMRGAAAQNMSAEHRQLMLMDREMRQTGFME